MGYLDKFFPRKKSTSKEVYWQTASGLSNIPPDLLNALGRSLSSSNAMTLTGTGNQFYTRCYDLCPPLQSVIRKKGEGLVNGKIIPVDPFTEKAVTPSGEFNKFMGVINRPNAQMKRNDLLMYIDACLSIYDVAYLYKVKAVGFDNVTGLIPIPNNAITPQYKLQVNIADPAQFNSLVESYTINIMGMPLVLRGDDVNLIHEIRGSGINLRGGNEYKPSSRIESLRVPITNIVASLESRNQIITKRGAEGIISPKPASDMTGVSVALDPEEKKRLQQAYEGYGYLDGQYHMYLAKVPMDYTAITRNVAQLGLFEGENTDKRTIALAYNMPAPLIGLPDEAKYNTFTEAQRQMYEGAVIPDGGIISQAFDEIFRPKGWKFYFDFSHLDCFQKSETERATALDKTITALTNGITAGLIEQADAKRIVQDFLN